MKQTPRPGRPSDGLLGLEDLLVLVRAWGRRRADRARELLRAASCLPRTLRQPRGARRLLARSVRALRGSVRRPPASTSPWYGLRTFSVAGTIFLLIFGAGLLIKVVDPLGLDGALQEHSERISTRVAAPFYGLGAAGERAQDHIAVVLVDDTTVAGTKEEPGIGWPPEYTWYPELLQRILAQQPRAVFVDILLERERGYDDSLAEADQWMRAIVAESGIPVFFASAGPDRPTLFGKIEGVGTAVVSWEGLGDEYPLVLRPDELVQWGGERDEPEVGEELVSPALALYRVVCGGAGADAGPHPGPLPQAGEGANRSLLPLAGEGAPKGRMRAAFPCNLTTPTTPMTLQWGYWAPESTYCVPDVDQPTGPWHAALVELGKGLRSGRVPDIHDAERRGCPYTLTVPAEHLRDRDVASVLRDRVVLVGTQIPGLNDFVLSPVHQKVPGVYLHAMALDNLLTWGDGHLRRTDGMFLGSEFLAAALAAFLAALVLRYASGVWRLIGLVAVGLGVILAQGIVLQQFFRQPPIDWVGGLTLFALVVFAVRDKVDKGRSPAAPGT